MSDLETGFYLQQVATWPPGGRHILAHYDERTIVVYQAYRPSIAEYALAARQLGGSDFSWARMSWIKPNFLWMMCRSAWATQKDQEVVLGLRISRSFFDELLGAAAASTYDSLRYPIRADWENAVSRSDVRAQWDPDHDPRGVPQPRRALQLGLRGRTLQRFGTSELLDIVDMNPLIEVQRSHALQGRYQELEIPLESVYLPRDLRAATNIGLSVMS